MVGQIAPPPGRVPLPEIADLIIPYSIDFMWFQSDVYLIS